MGYLDSVMESLGLLRTGRCSFLMARMLSSIKREGFTRVYITSTGANYFTRVVILNAGF